MWFISSCFYSIFLHPTSRFADKGSRVATTMTYQSCVSGFMKEFGLGVAESLDLMASSVQLARQAFSVCNLIYAV